MSFSVYETIKAGERFLSSPFVECIDPDFIEQEPLQSDGAYRLGDRVVLQGLKSAELNGKAGRVVKNEAGEGRFEVKLDDYECPVKVTPDRMTFEDPIRPGTRVILQGLNTTLMNGKQGTAKRFLPDQGRWEIELDDFDCAVKVLPKSLKREPTVHVGDRVTLQNLQAEDMNGKSGMVTNYNPAEGRWEVAIDGDDVPVQVTPHKIAPSKPSEEAIKQQSIKPGSRVVFNDTKLTMMNGRSGSVKNFIADEDRWEVEMDGDEFTVKVGPEALTVVDDTKENKKAETLANGKNAKTENKKKKKRFFGRTRSVDNE